MDAPLSLSLDDLPHAGTSGCGDSSYYAVTGVVAGTVYVVSATTSTGLTILDPSTPSQLACDHACEATATSSTLYVGASGLAYELDVQPATNASEGSEASPVPLTLDDLPHDGGVQRGLRSYYAIADVTPGTSYLVTLTGTQVPVTIVPAGVSPFEFPSQLQRELEASSSELRFSVGTGYLGTPYTLEVMELP
jgi:hypothetical protein